ncbi:MAG: hypothetical protein R2799_13160 [Crocinitomicaceae bacterium]|nr:hypothetical protein [Crocinitomicaceae bacterium]
MKTIGLIREKDGTDFSWLKLGKEGSFSKNNKIIFYPAKIDSENLKYGKSEMISKDFICKTDIVITNTSSLFEIEDGTKPLAIICDIDFTKEFQDLMKFIGSKVDIYSLSSTFLIEFADSLYNHLYMSKQKEPYSLDNDLETLNFLKEKITGWIIKGVNTNITDQYRIMYNGKIINKNIIKSIDKTC